MKNKGMVWLGVILGVVFLVIGYIYMTHSAGALPKFFPGYTTGESHVHTKHALAAFIVGVACFIYAWFQSGPKRTSQN